MKYLLILGFALATTTGVRGQGGYTLLRFTSTHNCFPDTARDQGHLDGDSIRQPRAGHYDDSSVVLVIPKGLRVTGPIDLVFWYHGWHNNIDTALRFYALADQFAASGRNAILVLPEAARNAADSYGGKMGQEGMFRLLVGDVVDELKRDRVVPSGTTAGHVVLAGHSGAYLVIADILEHGQQPVDEIFLFDALYGHVPVFMKWAVTEPHRHFVHWFTNTGYGPDEMSDTMMSRLRVAGVSYGLCEEASVNPAIVRDNGILFVHSPRQHNAIVNHPDDLAFLLANSWCLKGEQTVRIREIRVKGPAGDLVYPEVVSGDSLASRAMNKAIAEQVLPDEGKGIRGRITHWIKEGKLSDVSYTVSLNDNGMLSLHVHTEEGGSPLIEREVYLNFFTRTGEKVGIGDLVPAGRLDSFKKKVLYDKRHFIEDYLTGLKKEVNDAVLYNRIEESIRECMEGVDVENFSLSPAGLEIIDRCELDGSYRGYQPGYRLFYPYAGKTDEKYLGN